MGKISFREIVSQSRTIEIELPGLGTLDVTYNPGAITPKFWGELADKVRKSPGTVSQAKVYQVAEFVTAWGILDDKNQMLPITEKNVAGLPTDLIDTLLDAIKADLYPPDTDQKKR